MSFRRAVKRIIEEIPEYPDPVPIPQELPCCISTGDSPQKHLTFKIPPSAFSYEDGVNLN